MSELPKTTVRIETEHLCQWSDHVESVADELLEARTNLAELESKLAAAQKKLLDYEGQTNFCMECERWAKKAERYRTALEQIINSWDCPDMDCQECGGTKIAKEALHPVEHGAESGCRCSACEACI